MAPNGKLLAEWFWIDRWNGSTGFLLPMEARGVYREMLTPIVLIPALWADEGHAPAIARVDMSQTSSHFATCPQAASWRRKGRR
jgi:hypothetical protein